MSKNAGLAAAGAVMLALTACAATANAAPAKIAAPAAADSTIYEAVLNNWEGTDRPNEDWIDTAATLVCKRIIGGIEPRIVPANAHNNEVVIAAAEDYVCEIDR